MDVVRVNDLEFRSYISNDAIQERVKEIAKQINEDLKKESPLFIGILNGSFMFAADLMREVTIKSEITFVKLASYSGTESTGEVVTKIGLEKSVKDRVVVIVEDIIDSGKTISELLQILNKQRPAKIILATLLYKPAAMQYNFKIDYIGFEVPNDFLVGYGLDYDGLGRNLKDIYVKV
jgi:hypoxanthine phosphoribosyltransferase